MISITLKLFNGSFSSINNYTWDIIMGYHRLGYYNCIIPMDHRMDMIMPDEESPVQKAPSRSIQGTHRLKDNKSSSKSVLDSLRRETHMATSFGTRLIKEHEMNLNG